MFLVTMLIRHPSKLPAVVPCGCLTSLLMSAVLLHLAATGQTATIQVGDHVLLPNQPDQVIAIQVSGGDPVAGLDLFVQVGDGGPELLRFGLPAGRTGPTVNAVELVAGTIFSGVTDEPVNIGSEQLPQTASYTLALVGGTQSVAADGVLAYLTVDTTSIYGGTWDLRLAGVLPYAPFQGPYDTTFAGQPAVVSNGQIRIVPTSGDFDSDGVFSASDIDSLNAAIRQGWTDSIYDVDSDGNVSGTDRVFWVTKMARTFFGDSDLNGFFDTTDLVIVFQRGEYEDAVPLNSTWTTGDWDGDGDFLSSDLVRAFQSGGFERGLRGRALAVPEPAGATLMGGLAAVGFFCCRRRATNMLRGGSRLSSPIRNCRSCF